MRSITQPGRRLRRALFTLPLLCAMAGTVTLLGAPNASAAPIACDGIAKQYVASRTDAEAAMFYRAGQLVGCW
jgi:hypothetical protein